MKKIKNTTAASVLFVLAVTIFDGLSTLLGCGTLLASKGLGQGVPDAPKEDGAEQILEGQEGVVDAQQQ